MSSHVRLQNSSTDGANSGEKTYFQQQRDALVGEITISLEQVLQNINKLNRSLEGVIAVGTEFGSVEALWSQFENVMAKESVPEEEDKDGRDHEEKSDMVQEVGSDETIQPKDRAR